MHTRPLLFGARRRSGKRLGNTQHGTTANGRPRARAASTSPSVASSGCSPTIALQPSNTAAAPDSSRVWSVIFKTRSGSNVSPPDGSEAAPALWEASGKRPSRVIFLPEIAHGSTSAQGHPSSMSAAERWPLPPATSTTRPRLPAGPRSSSDTHLAKTSQGRSAMPTC